MAEDGPPGVRVAGIGGTVHYYGRRRPVPMTKEERAARIKALLAERESYRERGEQSRVDLVDKALRDMGAEGEIPFLRSQRRVVEPDELRGDE